MNWPEWWEWELELTPHVEKRMEDRGFSEVDLRSMLERATGLRPDHVKGRFVVECSLRGSLWHVILEPDATDRLIVVITAYALEVKR